MQFCVSTSNHESFKSIALKISSLCIHTLLESSGQAVHRSSEVCLRDVGDCMVNCLFQSLNGVMPDSLNMFLDAGEEPVIAWIEVE